MRDVDVPIATIAQLWRYPVKGMRGQQMQCLQLDRHGVAHDRLFGIASSGAPRGKPLLTGAERAAMLLYAATGAERDVRVITPAGECFCASDPRLLEEMQQSFLGRHALRLVESVVPLTDVRPVAVLGTGTVAQLERELGRAVDARRFRANILIDLAEGFAEDSLAGQNLRIGKDAVLHITERDPRCRIVTLDPFTAMAEPDIMKHLDRHHEGRVGVYATVASTGHISVGDIVTIA